MKYSVIKSCEGFFKIVSKTEFENKCKQFEEYLEKVLPTSVADCPIFSIDEEAFFNPVVASSFSFKLTYNVPKSV